MARMIETENFDVDEIVYFSDSVQAMRYIRENRPEYILTDVCMPEIDGIEIVKYAYNFLPYTIVVFISAYRDFEYVQSAMHYNVRDYILKLFSHEEFCEKIRKILEMGAGKKDSFSQTLSAQRK